MTLQPMDPPCKEVLGLFLEPCITASLMSPSDTICCSLALSSSVGTHTEVAGLQAWAVQTTLGVVMRHDGYMETLSLDGDT